MRALFATPYVAIVMQINFSCCLIELGKRLIRQPLKSIEHMLAVDKMES